MTQPLDELLEEALGPALGPVVQALGDYICRRMQGKEDGGEWVSQHGSDLGPRVHCAKVTELIDAGRTDVARKRGKRRELRRDAYQEALSRKARPPVKVAPQEDKDSKWDRRYGGTQ